MRKTLLLLLGVCLMSLQLFAQRSISGTVLDENGKPIPNASIIVKGTKTGTTSKVDGTFSIVVPAGAKVLVISSVGHTPSEMAINNQAVYNVALLTEDQSLKEVIVTGYSKTTKEAFTGTIKKVDGEKINNKSVSNVSQALAGEVAGVRVINTSGQPGTSAIIRIRGLGSVNGNRSPLYVVDGVPYAGQINSLNPSDIESMTVLKDAAATSIYGSRGANGVIVVTTRTGAGKKSFIEVDGKVGTNKALLPRYSVITSPEEFIGLSWEGLYNNGVALNSADPVNYANIRLFSTAGISPNNNIWLATTGAALIDPVTRMVRPGSFRKYDPERWEDYAFQPSNRTEANIKFGGSNGKTNYFTSFGYIEDKGYSIKSDFRRLSGLINLTHEVKPWLTTTMSLNYANAQTNNNGQGSSSNSVFWFVDNIPSIYPLFRRDAAGNKIADPFFGGFQYDYGENGRKFGSLTNAIADATYNTSRSTRNDLNGNTSFTIKFSDALSLQNRLGVQYFNNNGVGRNNKFYGSARSQNGSINQTKTELMNLNLLNLLRYAKKFNSHNVELLAAHEATKYKQTVSAASGYNLVDNNSLELANAIVINPTATSYSNTNRLESYFGQLNYDYDRTYFLSATLRRDGSSRFTKGNAWGTFGSVGLGWEISKMNFMRKASIIKYLKLKASYGIQGDQDGFGFYPGTDRYEIGNLNNNPSFSFTTKGNPDLTWESAKMLQAGVEFKLGRFLTGAVDYYVKNTDNLIFDRRVGISSGFAIIQVNDGQLRNQGLEFDLTGHIVDKKNVFLNIGINGEHFTNKITTMPIDPSTGTNKIIDVQSPYAWSKGSSIYDYYIRNFAGVDPATGVSTWTVYYDDLNSNGIYNVGEQVLNLEDFLAKNPAKNGTLLTGITKKYEEATQYYIGKSSLPKLRGAFNLNGGFKGIQVDVQFLYSLGGYAYDGAYANLMANGLIGGNNWHTDIFNRWQKAGDITDVPRISNNFDANVVSTSSRFLTKADYLSLNNVRVAYTLPAGMIQSLKIVNQVTFFVSGDNLILLTKRKGFNPTTAESGNTSIYTYSPLSTLTTGLKVKF
ncbi:MAG: SusC/RagA family TonB-linked outer membrane protein [Chitinophagaceae bacterium]